MQRSCARVAAQLSVQRPTILYCRQLATAAIASKISKAQFERLQMKRHLLCAAPSEAASIMTDSNREQEGEAVAPVDGSTLNDLQTAIMDALDSSGALGE
jgi:hypothetical protein